MNDLISRQAAIDALARTARDAFNLSDEYNNYLAGLMDGENAIRGLPSAQPEPLTDKEQRIFLAAMAREEKVCKQVDAECRDRGEPYEDIVRICHEIRRKVKSELWT